MSNRTPGCSVPGSAIKRCVNERSPRRCVDGSPVDRDNVIPAPDQLSYDPIERRLQVDVGIREDDELDRVRAGILRRGCRQAGIDDVEEQRERPRDRETGDDGDDAFERRRHHDAGRYQPNIFRIGDRDRHTG